MLHNNVVQSFKYIQSKKCWSIFAVYQRIWNDFSGLNAFVMEDADCMHIKKS